MTAALCACGQPVPDATICRDCTGKLGRDLAAIPWLVEQLDLSLSRQTASERQDGGRSAETPMPYDLGASDALEMLGVVLRRWSRALGVDTRWGMSDALATHLDDLRQHADADRAVIDIGGAVAKARRTIDRRPERWFAGPCDGNGYTIRGQGAPEQGCGEWLYARPEARDVKCKACTTVYDVEMRRAWMLEAAEDYLCTAKMLSRFVSRFGAPVKANTITQWRRRGRLEQRGVDQNRDPLYRIGDVLSLVHGENVRAAAKQASTR